MKFYQFLAFFALYISAFTLSESNFDAKFDGENFNISSTCHPITDIIVYEYCSSTNVFQIKGVTLNPSVLKKGQKFEVALNGTANEDVIQGTNVHVTAKLGIFTVLDKDYDFCQYVEDENVKCPILKGEVSATEVVDIPSTLPSGIYLIDVLATSPSKKQVLRIQLKFKF